MNRPTFEQALLQTVAYRGIRETVGKVLDSYDLNVAQWIILGLLSRSSGQLRITDIAHQLRVEDPLVTNLLRPLVGNGLVASTPHRSDKRARVLSLTPKGDKLITKIEPELAKRLASVEACASPADWETYFATLEKIVAATSDDE